MNIVAASKLSCSIKNVLKKCESSATMLLIVQSVSRRFQWDLIHHGKAKDQN